LTCETCVAGDYREGPGTCACITSYYDKDKICVPCSKKCNKCEFTDTNCTECPG